MTDKRVGSARSVPILMYHQVTPEPPASFRKYALTPAAFARQIGWLAARGYHSISLGDLIDHRSEGRPLPARPILITFDDGFADAVRWALPVLERHRFGATFFVVAALVGDSSRWLASERGLDLPLADWAALRELLGRGFNIGSHSLTHPRLTTLGTTDCRRELTDSRRLLEDRLAAPVADLAYPHGAFDDRVRALASEAGYRSACTVQIGLARPGDDPLALRRVPISGSDTFLDFLWRLRTGYAVRRWIRRQLGRNMRKSDDREEMDAPG